MKALILLAATSALAAPRWNELEGYTFEAYLRDFGKSYADDELLQRRQIFEKNLVDIRRHNAGGATWRLGVNKMTDYTAAERRSLLGYTKTVAAARRTADIARGKDEHVEAARAGLKMHESVPDTFSWRNRGVISAIKDQGQCGSCWAFASTATLESHIAVKTGGLPDLSEQQLVSCAPNTGSCGGFGGCGGSIPELAYQYLKDVGGQAASWTYGYESYWGTTNGTCHFNNRNGGTPAVATVGGYVRVPSNHQPSLLSALQQGPIAVSVDASEWHNYEGGVFDGCSKTDSDINHVVQLVGYGIENDVPYWEIRNSWSPAWGLNGYIRILRAIGSPHCMIDTHPQDGTGCLNPPGPANVTVCGTCGILYDPVYPTGVALLPR